MSDKWPFPIPESVEKKLMASLTDPEFGPRSTQSGQLAVFTAFDSLHLALCGFVKSLSALRDAEYENIRDAIWMHELALERIIDHMGHYLTWGQATWQHDPAVLELVNSSKSGETPDDESLEIN